MAQHTITEPGTGHDERPTRLVVVADDYAFTPGIGRAIRELLAAQRISGTGAMSGSPYWPEEAAALKPVAGSADIGLHFTLTDHKPLGCMPSFAPAGRFPPMGAVFKAGLARRLPLLEIRAELDRQIEAFAFRFGAPPAYIDGHHHVQQLPGVREIVIEAAARLGRGRVWVRSGAERPSLILRRGIASAKAFSISALGGAVARRARRSGVPTNRGFSGAYAFQVEQRPLEQLFARFVLGAGENALIFTHPGYADATLAALDTMTTTRDAEVAYLMGDQWPALLRAARLELGPFRHALRHP